MIGAPTRAARSNLFSSAPTKAPLCSHVYVNIMNLSRYCRMTNWRCFPAAHERALNPLHAGIQFNGHHASLAHGALGPNLHWTEYLHKQSLRQTL